MSHFHEYSPMGFCLAPNCGASLEGRRRHSLTCSPRCRQRFRRAKLKAQVAGGDAWAAQRALAWGLELRDFWRTPHQVFTALSRLYGPFHLDAAATQEDALAPRFLTPEDNALSVSWVQASGWSRPRRVDLVAAGDAALYGWARREGWRGPCGWDLPNGSGFDLGRGLTSAEREAAIAYLVGSCPRVWVNPPYSRKAGRGCGLLAWVQAAIRARDEGARVVQLVQASHATEWAKLAKREATERLEPDRRIPFVNANPEDRRSQNRHESMVFVYEPGRRGPAVSRSWDWLPVAPPELEEVSPVTRRGHEVTT